MKRLFSIVVAALYSLFAGVGYVDPLPDEFYFRTDTAEAPYYQPDIVSGEKDWKGLYGSTYGTTTNPAEACDPVPEQDTRDEWKLLVEMSTRSGAAFPYDWSSSLYFPIDLNVSYEVEFVDDYVIITLLGDEDVNITAPAAGYINTSHFACGYGKYMEYVISFSDGSIYTVNIQNAKCWYCCAHKTPPEDGLYTATTTDSLKGKKMSVGDILCVGKAGTTITISFNNAS